MYTCISLYKHIYIIMYLYMYSTHTRAGANARPANSVLTVATTVKSSQLAQLHLFNYTAGILVHMAWHHCVVYLKC